MQDFKAAPILSLGTRCSLCGQEATIECKNCNNGAQIFCASCATSVHSRAEFRHHMLVYLNIGHVTSSNHPLPPPSSSHQIPVYYRFPPQMQQSYSPPSFLSSSPQTFGGGVQQGYPPEVISMPTPQFVSVNNNNALPSSSPSLPSPPPLYPDLHQHLESVANETTSRHLSETSPLLRNRPSPPSGERGRVGGDTNITLEEIQRGTENGGVPASKTGDRILLLLALFTMLSSTAGKVFYDQFLVLQEKYFRQSQTIPLYTSAQTSPLLIGFVFAVCFIFGFLGLLFTRPSFKIVIQSILHPLITFPALIFSAQVILPWWACSTKYPEVCFPGDDSSSSSSFFFIRFPAVLFFLAFFSVLLSRNKRAAWFGGVVGVVLAFGILLIYWIPSEFQDWESNLGMSLTNAGLIVAFPLYLGAIRLACRILPPLQVFVGQSFWISGSLFTVFFSWNPSWKNLDYHELFRSDTLAAFGGAVGLYFFFFLSLFLLIVLGNAQFAGIAAIGSTFLSQFLIEVFSWSGYRWYLINSMQYISREGGGDGDGNEIWNWDSKNIFGTVLTGLSILGLLPLAFVL